MIVWYVTMEDKSSGTVVAPNEERAREIAQDELLGRAKSAVQLPYPHGRQIVDCDMPSFCWRGPAVCGGKSSCPGNPSCTD